MRRKIAMATIQTESIMMIPKSVNEYIKIFWKEKDGNDAVGKHKAKQTSSTDERLKQNI